MRRILKERDRLLEMGSRSIGMGATATAILCISVPGAIALPGYLLVLICLLLLALCQYRLVSPTPSLWLTATLAVGLTSILVVGAAAAPQNIASVSAVVVIASGSLGSLAIMLVSSAGRRVFLAVGLAMTLGAALAVILSGPKPTPEAVALILAGWAACAVIGVWLCRAVPRVITRISRMGQAYRAERLASEAEARRRQGARLLHDTVLATLTLLAHSGVGVSEQALRQQAAEDATLLRQLRLGANPTPHSSGDYNLRPVDESSLGNTLESVKQRFRRMGLDVTWHGTGHVLLPSEVLDSFLLALAECLENVRRHSGVSQAHVTITDDDATVRAMVTDAGIGFDLDAIEQSRLGFTESIVARLRDVGGNARLFSSPGSGTTVVLEVPK
ncbi:MAG: ATP-binding protein [Microbacteriaceae bacterium]